MRAGGKKETPAPPPLPAGLFVAHYMSGNGLPSIGFRSVAPHSRGVSPGTATQALRSDDSVHLSMTNVGTAFYDNGFITVPLRLGDIHTIELQLETNTCCGGSPSQERGVHVDLWSDVDADGDFFEWDADGNFVAFGNADHDHRGPRTEGLSLSIDDATEIDDLTLGALKGGAIEGVSADTRVAIVVRFGYHASLADNSGSALVSSLRVNGIELLVP